MALFDPNNPKSKEAQSYLTAKQLIASVEEFAELVELDVGDPAAARIVIGPMEDPVDGVRYSMGDIEEAFAWCQLCPPEEQSFTVVRSTGLGGIPEKAIRMRCHFRRYVRPSEFNDLGGRTDVYLFFLDRTTRIVDTVIELSEHVWDAQQISRLAGPYFNPRKEQKEQGIFIWTDFLIEVGTQAAES